MIDKNLPFLLEVNGGRYSFQLSEAERVSLPQTAEFQKWVLHGSKNKIVSVTRNEMDSKSYEIQIDGRAFKVQLLDEVDQQVRKMNLTSKKINLFRELKAPMPGLVRQILVTEGNSIKKGDALIILEAMKMENILTAPMDGVISELFVKPSATVEKNQILISFK